MSTLISKLDICDLMMICLLPCLYQAIIPCYSQLTKGLQVFLEVVIGNHFPISIQISWHVGSFSAGFLTSGERGGLLWTATCDRVQNLLSKSLNLNQTRFNPIICVFFSLFFWKMYAPPTSLPSIPTTLSLHVVCCESVACIHNVGNTCVPYVGVLALPRWD